MHYDYLTTNRELEEFCSANAAASAIAFDTEFISEDTYASELCLVQVAIESQLTILDPLAMDDMTPFWRLLATPGHDTIVHSGREEFRFCLIGSGQRPAGWFDVQIAAAFIGMEYPAAYSNLISRLLGKKLSKGETRTDWRRRPLSKRQLEYAVQDALHLQPMRDILRRRIDQLGRRAWFEAEIADWQRQIEDSLNRSSWRRLPGLANFSGRQLAVARAIWKWRDEEAKRRNSPARRVLRDDLLVELARRESDDVQRIRAIRGLDFRHVQRYLSAIAETIAAALKLDESEWPRPTRGRSVSSFQLTVLSQFLNTALGCICRNMDLTPGIVATVDDIRELVALRLGLLDQDAPSPALNQGWRAEVIGKVLDDLLAGKLAIRVADPLSEQPLVIEPRSGSA